MLAWIVIDRRHLRHSTPISSSLRPQRLCVRFRLSPKSLRFNLFADPHPVNPVVSIFYEKGVGRGATPDILSDNCLKSFRCNTYGSAREYCKQKTYGLAKLFRCNTYKKPGVPSFNPNAFLSLTSYDKLSAAMPSITKLDNLWTGRPHTIAAGLLESDGHRSIVDPGPGSTLETFRQNLHAHGIGVGDLDAILLTHIHLDHAGATGALVRENPRLAVYVHKLGAPHMIDPSKLLASAQRLWPDDLQRLFGECLPVPAQNLRILEGGEMLTLGSRKVEVVYTPGHASHHVSSSDSAAMDSFMSATFAEISQHLPGGEAEHYAFSAGLNLSFLGLARYLRKRAAAAS